MTTPALMPAPRRRARLLRYSLWQFRDYAVNIAIASIILFGLLGALEVIELHAAATAMAANLAALQVQSFQHLFSTYAAVGPIFAVSGVVSQDRALGYVRLLFAKPLDPLRFYLQSFVVRAVGFFVVGGVLLVLYRQFAPSADPWRIAVGLALSFVAFGGMVFLASVLSKYDGLYVIAFMLVAILAWLKWEASAGPGRFVAYLFPPIARFSALNAWVSNIDPLDSGGPAAFPTKWVTWTVCYGVACLVLGVVMLRTRPLARA